MKMLIRTVTYLGSYRCLFIISLTDLAVSSHLVYVDVADTY